MQFGIRGAIALAIALAAGTAGAHELSCTQTLGGKPAIIIDNYPATITAVVTVRNVHPTSASVVKSFEASFLESLSTQFEVATPFTLDVGEKRVLHDDLVITSAEECLRLARPDGIIISVVKVGWELGEAQCNAEIVCKPQRCEPRGEN